MSQEKAQLIAPIGHFTVPGLNVAGVVTATSFSGNCTGTASSITKGASLVVGVMTATSFVGDVTGNVTGIGSNTDNLDVGIVTATSFAGNFTGIGSGLTGTPNVVAGVVTATKFVGNTPGTVSKLADGTNINVGVVTATKFVGNTSGLAGGISAAQNINVGVLTATGGLYGDGSGLTGAGSTAFIRQTVTASVSAAINLNLGNVIYFVHDADATVSFANTTTATDVTIIRTLTDNTLTWPSGIVWNGGSAPTIIGSNTRSTAGQVFNLVTYNGGTNWYGYEEVDSDPQTTALFVVGQDGGNRGGLGLNDTNHRSSPTQIPGNNWNNTRGEIASKTDGTLWVWGHGGEGALANNATTQRSSPIQIPGTWTLSQSNYDKHYWFGGAVRGDGTLWMWGDNDSNKGVLGQNSQTSYSSPVQVIGSWNSGIQELRFGHGTSYHVMARNDDNELWCWGNGDMGQLAQNNRTKYSSPVQVPGSWSAVSGGKATTAIKTDGTMWIWGNNGYVGNIPFGYPARGGGLGLNTPIPTYISSPTQLPGTSWVLTGTLKSQSGANIAFKKAY